MRWILLFVDQNKRRVYKRSLEPERKNARGKRLLQKQDWPSSALLQNLLLNKCWTPGKSRMTRDRENASERAQRIPWANPKTVPSKHRLRDVGWYKRLGSKKMRASENTGGREERSE